MITTLAVHTGREKEHMAGPSGDGYNCLLGPHAHLYSQQALLSKGAPLQGRALPALDLAVSVFPLLSLSPALVSL